MEVSKLIQNMREQGIGIWTEGGKIRYLKKDGKLDDDIKNILIYNKKEIISYFEEERERFDKFPLTDIQMAYLLGRKNSFEYGDVASHLYLELDYPALDSVKVQKIWNQLIDKHDMLRAIVLEDGTQEVLRDVAEYPIYISTKCEEIRSKWSDKYYNTETWPMFDIGVTEDKEKTTLHLSFDFLIADWASIWTLLIEFETIYYNKGNGDEKCAISFRNYVLNEMGMKNSSRYRRDKEYWKNRLDIIPEAPVLPMRSNAEKSNKFIRMARKLSAEDWEKIKFFSSQNSVTPTATVLSIFALCIERWSVNKKFSLNLTTLIRNNKYTGIYNTIGDFTSVDVLEIDLSEKIIFADFVKNVNKQIFEDLDHSSYSGIEVIRDLRKRRKNPMLLFPIIFTSSIGLIKNDGMVGKVNIIEKDTKMKNNSGLWEFVNSTKEKRFEAYAKAIEKKTCINVSAELLEATFEIYQHGFKGANVELPFYSGDICYLSACEEQKYFFADKNQNLEMWNDICLGEFEVINVPGNHVTCIHSEENATLLAQIIIERNIRG